jgi:phosphoribosyl-ATP pyrophosphohydrolase
MDTPRRLEVLAKLADIVAERRTAPPETSYTAKLLAAGLEKCAKKVGEEGVETALAALTGDRAHLRSETADLFYHILVLLEASRLPLEEVMDELHTRLERTGSAKEAKPL